MTAADDYNAKRLTSGDLKVAHITAMTELWQSEYDLEVDGMAGPATIASIEASMLPAPAGDLRVSSHWLTGPGVTRIDAHPSWYGALLTTGAPRGIVAHYTATDPGTAINMAKRRAQPFDSDPDNRLASWHVTIETDGSIVQMVPLDRCAWHAGSSTAKPISGLGQANYNTVGIELVGYGKAFPAAQVESAKRVWRALVQHYKIAREYAMLQHSAIDPTRRSDPGPVWIDQHATSVLESAYEVR